MVPSSLWMMLAVLALIFVGEAFAIYAEMRAARIHSQKSDFIDVFKFSFVLMLIGGGMLIAGYVLGYQSFNNIWIVSAVSITSILVIEPILAYSMFHQFPTRGALLGFIFGIAGFIAALTLK